jgi:hypothetical protein
LEDVPQRLDEFLTILHSILGQGARVIEKLVIARLVETNEIPLAEARGRSLADIIALSGRGHSKARPTA